MIHCSALVLLMTYSVRISLLHCIGYAVLLYCCSTHCVHQTTKVGKAECTWVLLYYSVHGGIAHQQCWSKMRFSLTNLRLQTVTNLSIVIELYCYFICTLKPKPTITCCYYILGEKYHQNFKPQSDLIFNSKLLELETKVGYLIDIMFCFAAVLSHIKRKSPG